MEKKENRGQRIRSDSVEHPLPIEYAADLTPAVAVKESWASWNARRMAETGCVFESEGMRRHGVRADTRKDCQTGRRPGRAEINWYSGKERRTSRLSAWRTHERSRIFGGHGCGLGGGRRPGTRDRPETESWSAPPEPSFGGPQGVLGDSRWCWSERLP